MNNPLMKRSTAPLPVLTLGLTLLTALAGPAMADDGQAVGVKIQEVATTASAENIVYIRLATDPTVRTGCSTHTHWHFVMNVSTAFGKATYPLLLAAAASGSTVTIYGADNTCVGNVEQLRYFVMSP